MVPLHPMTPTAEIKRLKSRISNIQETAAETTRRSVGLAMSGAGGATAGALQARMPNIPGTDIPTDLAVGSLVSLAGLTGLAGEWNDPLLSYGGGMLAAGLANITREALS